MELTKQIPQPPTSLEVVFPPQAPTDAHVAEPPALVVREQPAPSDAAFHTEATAKAHAAGRNQLLVKRSGAAKLLGIGRTLLIELSTPGHTNFDESFPVPVRITKKGPAFFVVAELHAWAARLKRINNPEEAANDANAHPEKPSAA